MPIPQSISECFGEGQGREPQRKGLGMREGNKGAAGEGDLVTCGRPGRGLQGVGEEGPEKPGDLR